MLKLFNISLQINGFPLKEAKAELKKIRSIPEQDFEVYIENKKREIVEFHLKNNNLYQKLVKSNSLVSWDDLPIMTKKDLQNPLLERLSVGFDAKNCYLNKTSGSSGEPFIFAKDKFSHALTWANNIYCFGQYGIDFNSSFQARFYGIPLEFLKYKKERFKDFLCNRFRFSIFNLSDLAFEGYLTEFKSKKFDYINGYTSAIVLFAKFLKQKNIMLSNLCPSLKICVVTSEMLFDVDKKLIENQFGVPVINEYGASELDLIAFENPLNEWKVNSETLYVEILDSKNKVLPYGQEGRIVITSLYNKAHPFIRYEIGDLGILDPKSTIKKPILKKLVGRTNDFAILPSGKKSPGLTFYYITKSIIEDDGNVKEFLIKQLKINYFEIEYVSDFKLKTHQIEKIEQALELYLEEGLVFQFTQKDKLERNKRGKLKQFISFL